MKFDFSDEGPDHANIYVYDRKGFLIGKSPRVGADEGAEIEEAARKLYKRYVLKLQKKRKNK